MRALKTKAPLWVQMVDFLGGVGGPGMTYWLLLK